MKTLLKEVISRIPGALGAAVVGLDGLLVEKVTTRDDFNIDLASAEGVGVIRSATSSLDVTKPEAPEEVSISRGSGLTILRSLGPDYYLCVVVDAGVIAGQARFEAWKVGHQLKEAIR
jgi:predicted regulator of Ras-like GTPase activity (Roadblock/LC7/MglB family)